MVIKGMAKTMAAILNPIQTVFIGIAISFGTSGGTIKINIVKITAFAEFHTFLQLTVGVTKFFC